MMLIETHFLTNISYVLVVVRLIKLQEQLILARRTELLSRGIIYCQSRKPEQEHRPRVMFSAVWASTELHGHQGSGANFHRNSNSLKRPTWVLTWFNFVPAERLRPRLGFSAFGGGRDWGGFILLRLNPLGQTKLPISLSKMLCFGRVCACLCALNVSAALQGAYITPFPTEVVRAIRAQRDEVYVSKIVCYVHVMASNPHPPSWRAPHFHHLFYFASTY